MIEVFTYQPLWQTLADLEVNKSTLSDLAGITPATMARMSRNENVALTTIEKICVALDIKIEQVIARQAGAPLAGTFRPNKSEPVHRWYPYLEGYSRQLVENEIRFRTPGETIYDPFGGSGTTPLTALMNGMTGLYSEINPVMRFITDVKLVATQSAMSGNIDLEKLRKHRDAFAEMDDSWCTPTTPGSLGEFDRFFSSESLGGVLALRDVIETEDDCLTRDLLRVVLASIVVPVSLMVRRGDLRFANQREKARTIVPFWQAAAAKIHDIVHDLEGLPKGTPGEYSFVSADVRTSEIAGSVDAVVTSPPYLNGTNYFRNTKLELRVLDMLLSESELGAFYQTGITAGINNVSSRREYKTLEDSLITDLIEDLRVSAYDGRIPTMIAGYFADMKEAIDRIHAALKAGGVLAFDIGDSQFAGVHVPTHQILSTIIQDTGFSPLDETVLRTRRSRNGMILTQRVMRYVKD